MSPIVQADHCRLVTVVALVALGVPAAASLASPPTSWAQAPDSNLASSGSFLVPGSRLRPDAVIDQVVVDPRNVFDLDNPKENSFFYRLADKLHIKTQPHVVSAQLLFKPGDQVEVQVDDGEWVDCELTTPLSGKAWVQWRAEVATTSGDHKARVRATDGTGETQTADRARPAPNGATGSHEISFKIA